MTMTKPTSEQVTFTAAGSGATLRNLVDKVREVVSVKDFGAVGDGVTNDTTAIQNALNACAGKLLVFPQGTYMIAGTGLQMFSDSHLVGYKAILKARETPTHDLLLALSRTNITIQDLTIDNNNYTVASNIGMLAFHLCTDVVIENCRLLNMDRFAFAINGGSNITVRNNEVAKTVAASSQNQGLLVSSSAGTPSSIRIENNVFLNTGVNVSCQDSVISGNKITGWKFGAGITTEQATACQRLFITNNVCAGGIGVDVNGYTVGGIENWAQFSVISGNIIYANEGAGIDQGGRWNTVYGNVIFNNGFDGIASRYGTLAYNASGSVYAANNVFDTAGGGGTQNYGYNEQSSLLSQITVAANSFDQNTLKPVNLLSTTTAYAGRKYQATATYDPPSLGPGASVITDITVPGAQLGALVQVSFSQDAAGILFTGYVNTANNVKVVLQNTTAGTVDLASGTLTATVEQTKISNSL